MNRAASIVIVHHRGLARLLTTLSEACRQAAAEKAEVIVVDNGSVEGAAREIARRHPAVRVVAAGRNLGFAAGCRLGVEAGEADPIVFLNDDAVPEEGWLALLRSAVAAAPPDVAAIGGRLSDVSGAAVDFAGGFVTFDGHAFADRVGAPLSSLPAGPAGRELLFACGGNMAVRRREFLESGGFDDDYFAYLEDVDFGWRQWVQGRRILEEPRALARHEGGATALALGVFRRGFLIEKNAFATAYKNLGPERLREHAPAMAVAFLSRIAAMLARNPGARHLDEDPYAEPERPRRKAWVDLARRLFGTRAFPDAAVLDDPLTLAQLRALRAIFSDPEGLERKRRCVQELRARPDEEIFARFPLAIVPTYPGDEIFATEFFRPFLPIHPLVARQLSEIFSSRA
jgi:GT2 family glycosyltransferase